MMEVSPAMRQAGWARGPMEPPVEPLVEPQAEPRGGPFVDEEALPPSVVGRDNPVLRQLADEVVAGRLTTAQAAEKWRVYKFTAPLMQILGALFDPDRGVR